MKSPITIYDRATGQIVRWKRVAFGTEPILLRDGEDWIAGRFDDGQFYIDPASGQPVPLRSFDVTVEPNRIAGIPPGSSALVKVTRYPVDDGEIVFEVDYPELLRVRLTHPLYHPLDVEVACAPDQD